MQQKSLKLIEKCNQYISHERHCSEALAGPVPLKTAIINLENSVVDAVTGGLTTAVLHGHFSSQRKVIRVCN